MGLDPTANPPQTVELRHTLADGSWHIDWMLDLGGSEDTLLTTFRLTERVDEMAPGSSLTATRIADHRRAYLTYEGEVSGGRGQVARIASGRIEAMQNVGDEWGLLVCWHRDDAPPGRQHLLLHRVSGDRWLVAARSSAAP